MMRRSPSLYAHFIAALFMALLADRAWCDPAESFIRVLPGPSTQFGTPAGKGAGYYNGLGACPVPRQSFRPPTMSLERAYRSGVPSGPAEREFRGQRSRGASARAEREFDRAAGQRYCFSILKHVRKHINQLGEREYGCCFILRGDGSLRGCRRKCR